MTTQKISLPVIRRLPRYYRHIASLRNAGVTTISSSALAASMGTTASQVRQDFNCFGGFGQQGIGYSVSVLCEELEKLLFSSDNLSTILIGTGRLGRAIGQFLANEAKGIQLVAAFDKSEEEIGKSFAGTTVQDVEKLQQFCQENKPQIAVLCVPTAAASTLAPILLNAGVEGFWNFSHYDLALDSPDVVVENVHLSDSLMSLGYRVRNRNMLQ